MLYKSPTQSFDGGRGESWDGSEERTNPGEVHEQNNRNLQKRTDIALLPVCFTGRPIPAQAPAFGPLGDVPECGSRRGECDSTQLDNFQLSIIQATYM